MFNVKIRNNADQVVTHFQNFQTLELAQAWITQIESKVINPWGKLERVINTFEATQDEFDSKIGIIPAEFDEGDNLLYPERIILPKTYTVEIQDLTTIYQVKMQIDEDIKRGKEDERRCKDALSYIGGYNRRRNLSSESIDLMQESFAQVLGLLISNRPDGALQAIEAIQVDGEIVTEELKINVITILSGA